MTGLNRDLPPIEQAAEALNSRHRYIDMHARRQEAILAGRSLLNVEQMARAMCLSTICDGSKKSCPDYSVNVQRATAIRAAQLGEHA